MRFVLVSGGVMSGIGKGIVASSIGLLLQRSSLSVTAIKIDPYLNLDAGTMSPYEHGEVFVLDDGGETDLDLGNYERFLDLRLTRDHNITTGKIYDQVIRAERRGDYLGKTVQIVPHVTRAISDWIQRVAAIPVDGTDRTPDVCIIELGGTVGDIESMVFLEALRRLRCCHIHVSFVPVVGEPKTKPTQHSIQQLGAAGLVPDLILCRSVLPLSRLALAKIEAFSMVPAIGLHDVPDLYCVPLLLREQKVHEKIAKTFGYANMPWPKLNSWEKLIRVPSRGVRIAVIGKYTGSVDAYLSVLKALHHAALEVGVREVIDWIDASDLESGAWLKLREADGVLIPGGFGERGIESKILAANYARQSRVPFLGICLGMQVAVIEFARNVIGPEFECAEQRRKWGAANSTEFDEHTPAPVVICAPETDTEQMGGTMRLGSRDAFLHVGSLAARLYGTGEISERHRHRYEVNPEFVARFQARGLVFSGCDLLGEHMEVVELPGHPFYLGTQFHPEFKSRPMRPSPPFVGFIRAVSKI